jgi:phage terminase large subunit-like protein
VDLSKTQDATGVGIVHVVGSKQVSRGFGKDRKYESRPIMRVDLALEVVAPLRGEIRISSVRELFYRLRDMGMMFGMISYDTWGSAESIQTLQGEGFSAEDLSVDRDASPYETLKEAIYDGRLICYDMPVLAMELATVHRDDSTGKIDHLPNGKKDVSDAIAGAVWQAEKGWSNGAGSRQWARVTGTASEFKFGGSDDNEILWDKVNRGIPLTEAEIYRLK